MKKILVASTALSLLGGAAFAEVKTTADARMGVQYYNSGAAGVDGEWDFTSRIRIIFTASGETDGGLAFGGTIRADQASDREETTAGRHRGGINGTLGNVWVSGAFGKIAMGDVDSAAEAANGQVWGVGLDDREWDHIAYIGAGSDGYAADMVGDGGTRNPVALYSYSFGDGNVFVSLADGNPKESYGVAGNYTFGDYTIGAGYEKTEETEQFSVSATAKFGAFAVKAIYADQSDDVNAANENTQYALGVNYTQDALGVSAFYKALEVDGADTRETYGIGASYNLGGGAKIVGGYAADDRANGDTREHFSLGIAMTF